MNFNDLRSKYQTFIYDKYEIIDNENVLKFNYYFEIPGLTKFNPSLEIEKKYIKNTHIDSNLLNTLVFHIGLVELISYWKCAMPKQVIVNAGHLDKAQIEWFKKLYYNGLGEFMYQNNINISLAEFMDIKCFGSHLNINSDFWGTGNLIAVGGGKDSVVSINLLKDYYLENDLFMLNPKDVHLATAKVDGYEAKSISVKRNLDSKIIELNKSGFLNGHTPFSALLSFASLLTAYLANKKYIVLSNENSANEASVAGTSINHQYSKSYEYECDFNNYVNNYFGVNIKYFSLLRPLSELQIAKLFASYKKYHTVFKSCNLGSKGENWNWCCACAKCLFVYSILSPFLSDEELTKIFGENLFAKEELLEDFIQLTGNGEHKPFECVGTYEEFNYAISKKIIMSEGSLPYLLNYYKEHFPLTHNDDLLSEFNMENNVPEEYLKLVRRAINE